MTIDLRITAIRDHKEIGRGSCSIVDECYSDVELLEALYVDSITSPRQAIRWALEIEGLDAEQALNARWGQDTDLELIR